MGPWASPGLGASTAEGPGCGSGPKGLVSYQGAHRRRPREDSGVRPPSTRQGGGLRGNQPAHILGQDSQPPGPGENKSLPAEGPACTIVHSGPRTLARAVEPCPPSWRMPSTSYTVGRTAARTGQHQEQMRGHHGSGRDKPARHRRWCPGKPDCKPASASGEQREEAEGVMPGLTSSVRRPLARSSAPAAPSTLLGTASSRTGRGAAPSPPGLPCLPGPLGPSSRPPGALLRLPGRPGATLGQALEQSLSLSALQTPGSPGTGPETHLPHHLPRLGSRKTSSPRPCRLGPSRGAAPPVARGAPCGSLLIPHVPPGQGGRQSSPRLCSATQPTGTHGPAVC